MRLYGVVIVVVGVYPRCVHSLHPFCGPGSGVYDHLRGHFSLSGDYIILQYFTNIYKYAKIFTVNYEPWR